MQSGGLRSGGVSVRTKNALLRNENQGLYRELVGLASQRRRHGNCWRHHPRSRSRPTRSRLVGLSAVWQPGRKGPVNGGVLGNLSSELSVRPRKSQWVEQVGFPEMRMGGTSAVVSWWAVGRRSRRRYEPQNSVNDLDLIEWRASSIPSKVGRIRPRSAHLSARMGGVNGGR